MAAGAAKPGRPSTGSWATTICKLPLYDSVTGGCRDGLHPDRANENQGAESTLSFLMALLEMNSLQESEHKENPVMTISAQKPTERDKQRFAPLLVRHPANPILSAKTGPIRSIAYSMRAQPCLPMARRCCFAAWKTAVDCRIFAPPARKMVSMDGKLISEPTLMPSPQNYPEEIWGIEDPRITFVPELQQYVVTYTSYSRGGPGVSLALTKDFRTFERYGVIMPPDDKDSALLPRRIDGYWALIHRPMTTLGSHMWISYSPDLRHWGRHRLMLEARRGAWWDANKIGLSPPPIETSRGWLVFYHGVRHTPSGCLYRLGLALFELENPEKCLLRGDSWIFGPEAEYERHGDVDDVVFPCGYTMGADGDTVNVYYGAADCSIALATASVRSLLEWLDANGSSDRRQR